MYIGKDLEFIIHIFYWCIQLDHEIYIKCKKTSNLIKIISSYNICSRIKSKQAKTFDFFQNSSVLFHQVTFDHSISCVLLIDKPNESFKNSKTFERNILSTRKKL